ncbi:hypothetical protein [Bdellovibrio sp. HCB337]|uniref:hypothetical protein n=1 Tax=Bdellovibrio sp. HCB337 TaxID=3394358 RepID=UPI0039A5C9BC
MSKNSADNKVLEFPKAKSVRKRLLDKGQDQKAVLGLSIVSVLVMTVFLNEWIVKSQNKVDAFAEGNRGIASFEDRDSVDGIKWEHELAQKLAQEKDAAKSLLAVKPTLKDELVFGFLEGKYKTHIVNSKIQSFDFTDNHAGDQPLVIKEKAEFLKIFKTVFALDYSKVQFASRQGNTEVYKLISSGNKDLGQAHFQLDEEGRVLSLKISQ